MDKQKYNELILETLSKLVKKYPDLRFGQLLVSTDIIQIVPNESGIPVIQDPFYEESKITWKRMLMNKFAFNEQYN